MIDWNSINRGGTSTGMTNYDTGNAQGFLSGDDAEKWYRDAGYEQTPMGWSRGDAAGTSAPGSLAGSGLDFTALQGALNSGGKIDVKALTASLDAQKAAALGVMGKIGNIRKPKQKLWNQFEATGENAEANAAMSLELGQQAGAAAGAEYSAGVAASGGGENAGAGAAMLRAKALLPVIQQNYQIKNEAIKQKADIASTIGNLKMNYINTLANYNKDKAGVMFGYDQLNQQSTLDARRINSTNRQNAASNALNLAQLQQQGTLGIADLGLKQQRIDYDYGNRANPTGGYYNPYLV